jgi:hypothetical protein
MHARVVDHRPTTTFHTVSKGEFSELRFERYSEVHARNEQGESVYRWARPYSSLACLGGPRNQRVWDRCDGRGGQESRDVGLPWSVHTDSAGGHAVLVSYSLAS